MEHQNRAFQNIRLTKSGRFVHRAAIFTIFLWIIIAVVAVRDYITYPLINSAIFIGAITLFIGIFIDLKRVPLQRWLISGSKWVCGSCRRFFIIIPIIAFFLGLGLHDNASLVYCLYKRSIFNDLLLEGWKNKLDGTGSENFGKAHALFRHRPEPYYLYQSARTFFTRRSDPNNVDRSEMYARGFLEGDNVDRDMRWCPILFCCSCISEGYFRLTNRIVRHEAHEKPKELPKEHDVDEYLLWLYHMSEQDEDNISNEEYDQISSELKNAANNQEWINSPIYPLVADHVMQIEYYEYRKSDEYLKSEECPDVMWKYTEEVIARYDHSHDISMVIPPNKTIIYYILKWIHSEISETEIQTPFPMRNEIERILQDCPQYHDNFLKKYGADEISRIVTEMSMMERTVTDGESYLRSQMKKEWMKFRIRRDWL